MTFAQKYLDKQTEVVGFSEPPHQQLQQIVVIPAYNEPGILRSITSLYQAKMPVSATEIVVIVNAPENAPHSVLQQNAATVRQLHKWQKKHSHSRLKLLVVEKNHLPAKTAGAGMARKTGMDAAVARFNILNRDNGLIISLDADTTVAANYFTELERHFAENPRHTGCNIYFEHPLSGSEFSSGIYHSIAQYELHLRYFVEAMRYTAFPYAFHTVGSCFAVRAGAYVRQGGMNRRRAGEDFYFLHKLMPLGPFAELNTTKVCPSSRPSERVPFGTGPVVRELAQSGQPLTTYNFSAFAAIRQFLCLTPQWFQQHPPQVARLLEELPLYLQAFLNQQNFTAAIAEINANVASETAFYKRFFQWFTAFRLIKFLNQSHQQGTYSKQPVTAMSRQLLKAIRPQMCPAAAQNPAYELLISLRQLQRSTSFSNSLSAIKQNLL